MRFSIIIPVYNAENFLSIAVESVINQTLDFQENIEIIFVNDGSTDGSGTICQNFVDRYPKNIKYIYTTNNGPSAARNIAIENLSKSSKYIGFLDADDYFSPNTLEKVDNFFASNSDIRMATIPLYHFEKFEKSHRLNYKYNQGTRVVNILEEHKALQFHIGGSFFRTEVFSSDTNFRFQSNIKFWEDALLINSHLLKNPKYGVISEAKYYYRKRTETNSLVDHAWYKKSRYTPMIDECYGYLIKQSESIYSKVIPYIQFLIAYHFRLYLFPKNNEIIYQVLNSEEQNEFFNKAAELLQNIDDIYIKELDIPFYYKDYMLNLKKFGWPYKEKEKKIKKQKVKITSLKRSFLTWSIEGNFKNKRYFMKKEDRLFIKWKRKYIYLPKVKFPSKRRVIWGTVVRDYTYSGFLVKIPFYMFNIQFGIEIDGKKTLLNKVNLKKQFERENKKIKK